MAHFEKKESRPLAILGPGPPEDGVEVEREGQRDLYSEEWRQGLTHFQSTLGQLSLHHAQIGDTCPTTGEV